MSFFKVTTGAAAELCRKYTDRVKAQEQQIKDLIHKVGAFPKQYVSYGTRIRGFYFPTGGPKGWRLRAGGYYVADPKVKANKDIVAEINSITLISGSELASDLGCEMFFYDLITRQRYLARLGVFEFDGSYFLQSHDFCHPNLKLYPEITPISASDWRTASDLSLQRPNAEASAAAKPSDA